MNTLDYETNKNVPPGFDKWLEDLLTRPKSMNLSSGDFITRTTEQTINPINLALIRPDHDQQNKA